MPNKMNKKEMLQTPKGTRDLLPGELSYWNFIESKARELAEYYGFQQIRTPHIEKTELFTATIGEATDIVEKQMYTFRTRGGDSLTLRPEGTAPIMRAYIQHGMHTWSQPVMLYYTGSFFRHEAPQKGRFREFGQFGFEIIGSSGAIADALVIRLIVLTFEELGLKNFNVHINTLGDKECRMEYRKDLSAYFRRKVNYLCKDCKNRLKTNPLRLLDCNEEKCRELQQDAPQIIDYVCDACKAHFKELLEFLDKTGISYFLDHRLVRGLDYYSRTVFEIFIEPEEGQEKEGRPLAFASGGRYDYLAEALGIKNQENPALQGAVGGAIGLDRVAEFLSMRKMKGPRKEPPKAFLVQLGPQAKQQSFILLEEFRKAHFNIASSLSKDSIKNQLEKANDMGALYAIILGQKEAIDGTAIVRDMGSGMQETMLQSKLLDYLKKLKKNK